VSVDALDQIVTLLSAASSAENIGTKLVYVAEARARLATVLQRTEAARLQLVAIEGEMARVAAAAKTQLEIGGAK
jgi:hypothetical protein